MCTSGISRSSSAIIAARAQRYLKFVLLNLQDDQGAEQ